MDKVVLPDKAEEAAQFIVDRGLATPAALFLGLNRPLAHLGSQAMIATSPFLAPLMGLERFRALKDVLADPDQFEAFLDRLEALSHEKDVARKTGKPEKSGEADSGETKEKDES